MRALGLVLPSFLILIACGKPVDLTPNYHRDVQPLLERSCLGCHKSGGIAPVVFDTPEKAHALAGSIWTAVESGRMPPFYASAECNSYRDDPRLTGLERQVLQAWVEAGAQAGDPADAQHAKIPELPVVRHDVMMSIGADYDVRTVTDGSLDNYRCFALDPKATDALLVAGSEVIPGNVRLVHHVLVYEVLKSQLAELQALDDGAPGPGYPCKSGSVGIDGTLTKQIAGWVPGAAPSRMPAGSGLHISSGSKLVVQIHYNLNALGSAGEVSPYDQTQVALEIAPPGTTERFARIVPMLNDNLDIPAYEKQSVQTEEWPFGLLFSGARIYGVMGHMHQLGTRVRLDRIRPGQPDLCLLDIQDWDFNWQRTYTLEHPITLGQDDNLRISCTYDNSQANQPYVLGVQQTPRRVQWGESSFDEMCMTYMTFTQ